jgi:hypothetical protein
MLYNLLASGINCLNVHGIMGTDENGAKQKVKNIIEAATNIQLTGVRGVSELSKPVGVMFFGGFTFVTIFGVGVLCLLRFFMVLALALLLPLILVFRLYPPFFRFSSTLTEVLMGMTLSTILVAAVVVLAQPMLTTGGFNGWIFAIAILLLCSSLATVLAPQIRGGCLHRGQPHLSQHWEHDWGDDSGARGGNGSRGGGSRCPRGTQGSQRRGQNGGGRCALLRSHAEEPPNRRTRVPDGGRSRGGNRTRQAGGVLLGGREGRSRGPPSGRSCGA